MSESVGDTRTPAERVDDVPLILRALRRAVRRALLEHKRAGEPVAVWRDGRVQWIPADEIPVSDLDDEDG